MKLLARANALPRPVGAIAAVTTAVVVHVIAQFSMLMTRSDWSWSAFRDFGAGDQLSYAAIVANAAQGQFDSVEPFTETGSIYYPRGYYVLLGAIARATGLSPTVAWSVVGLVVQALLVAMIGATCILLSRRLWTGVLGFLPFVLGTLSVVTTGTWFTKMDSHALLWGPFAVLFPLNGEAAGLCMGGIALLLLALAHSRAQHRRLSIALALTASALIGAIANVQTYSFLCATYLAVFIVAATALAATRQWRRVLLGTTAALAVAVIVGGPVVSDQVGQLATLVFGLLPALPGLAVAIVRTRGFVALCGALAVLFAAPSVLSTVDGLAQREPFLVYRVASSVDLGVIWPLGLIGSLVLTVPLVIIFTAGIRSRTALWIALPCAALAAWTLLAANDLWGANQEPYRFWIDCFTLIAIITVPVFVTVVQYLLGRGVAGDERTPHTARLRVVSIVAVCLTAAIALVSLADAREFYRAGRHMALLTFEGPQFDAIQLAGAHAGNDLVLTDPCLNPLYVKVSTGQPLAHMNQGMAWPEKYEDLLALGSARASGEIDFEAARAAGVVWVMLDTSCPSEWDTVYAQRLTDRVSVAYEIDGLRSAITVARLNEEE